MLGPGACPWAQMHGEFSISERIYSFSRHSAGWWHGQWVLSSMWGANKLLPISFDPSIMSHFGLSAAWRTDQIWCWWVIGTTYIFFPPFDIHSYFMPLIGSNFVAWLWQINAQIDLKHLVGGKGDVRGFQKYIRSGPPSANFVIFNVPMWLCNCTNYQKHIRILVA